MKRVQSFEDTRRRRSRILKGLRFIAILFFVYEIFSIFVMKSYTVGSKSMAPGLVPKDRVIVFSSAYGIHNPFNDRRISFKAPERGDVVLMSLPSHEQRSWMSRFVGSLTRFLTLQYFNLPDSDKISERPVILRIVAVPGDSVRLDDYVAYVKPGGQPHYLTEYEVSGRTYDIDGIQTVEGWNKELPLSGNLPFMELGQDEFFVVGDNRVAASDSRFFGPVTSRDLIGRVVARYWPLDRLSHF
jgi:signal peptidase I